MIIPTILLALFAPNLQAQTLQSAFAVARQAAESERSQVEKARALSQDIARGALSADQLVAAASDTTHPLWLREEAVYNLGIRYFIEALPAIKRFAADPNPGIAAQALSVFERHVYPDAETLELLLSGLKNRAPEPRIAAADTLRQFAIYHDAKHPLPMDRIRDALKEALAKEKFYYAHDRWVAGPAIVTALKAYGVCDQDIDRIWQAAPEN